MISKTKSVYPVLKEEAKKHLRLDDDFTDDDEYVNLLIGTATQVAEDYIEKDIAKTSNTLKLKDFYGSTIELNEGNFLSVTSIGDAEGNSYANYVVYVYDSYVVIKLESNISTTELTVEFETGYEKGTCPMPIRKAILVKVGDLYDIDRSSYVSTSIRNTGVFEALLNKYKAIRFKYYREC